MISFRCSAFVVVLAGLFGARVALAQTVPTVTQTIPARSLLAGSGAITVDLRSHFGVPDVTGTVVQVDTTSGRVNFELFDDTPLTKANFLAYVNAGRYAGTVIHRVAVGFVVQAGGYLPRLPLAENHIPTFPPVKNEFRRSNVRGTVAMAKVGGDPDSATSEWFVNLANNNAANLDAQNGGFTVFARVLGNGMSVIDAIAALPRAGEVPLRDLTPEQLSGQQSATERNLVLVNNVFPATIYPPGTRSVLAFTAQSSNSAIVTATVTDSTLVLTPVSGGTATITVRATDTNNANAETTFAVTVTGGIAIAAAPQSQHVAAGAAVNLSVTAQAPGPVTYQWLKNGEAIAGATNATLSIPSASAAEMGFYAVSVTSGGSTVTTDYAAVTVNVPGGSRLVNVSTRGDVRPGQSLTPGFVMRGTGTKNLVLRAVGPSLTAFGVAGALTDPKMEVIPLGQTNVVLANDDWGSAPPASVSALTQTSAAVGAFVLPPNSKDAAALAALSVTGSGGYTVGITPAGTATGGIALAEIYDADDLNAATRLINVSTLGAVTADGLTPGFVIGGSTPKLLLIRAVGPTLTTFNVSGALADPTLTVFPLGKAFAVATNNDWSDGGRGPALEAAFTSAAAFALQPGSKDAAVLVRLPPGAYTAVATGVGGTTGRALVEVYDLDP